MLSTYEASLLTRSRTNATLGVGTVIVAAVVLGVMAFVVQLGVATGIANAVSLRVGGADHDKHAQGTGGAPLFLGYVEFDWDPARSSGTAGFGPAPKAATVDVAAVGTREK